jgi:phage/plasmid-associated DNA primase
MTETTVESVLAQDQQLYDAWHRYSVLRGYVNRLSETMENLRLKLGAMRSTEATRRKTIDDEPR